MTNHIPEILLWLFTINLGIAFGAGLYEMRITMPQWFIKSPEFGFRVNSQLMRETDVGRRFWGFVTTMPLTLLTLANLAVACFTNGPMHNWLLAASLIVLVDRIGTFSFFIPKAILFMRPETTPSSKIGSLVLLWIRLNYVRNILTIVGWLAALKALSGN